MTQNVDQKTVKSFGDEWSRFDQSRLSLADATKAFEDYFAHFPWESLPPGATGFDMGCGTGRWAKLAAPRVGHLHCIDPSSALEVARAALASLPNVTFHSAAVGDDVLPKGSQDFGYSLGVLHHVPDTAAAIASCAGLLKPGAPFLVYLYYAFDNRGPGYRFLWKLSDGVRRVICRLPAGLKHLTTDFIALTVYWPAARLSLGLEKAGIGVGSLPLSHYRDHSLYTMRTDARDRFGTPLEQRFTRDEINAMLRAAGFDQIRFSDRPPFWCAVGIKK